MNSHIASLQLIGEFSHTGLEITLPPYFREIVQKLDITDYEKLQDYMLQELQSGSLSLEKSAGYVSFVGKQLLFFQFLRKDARLAETLEVAKHRILSSQIADTKIDVNAWKGFLDIVEAAYLRVTRKSTLESFEDVVSNISWAAFQAEPGWLSLVSGMVGIAYLNEEESEQYSKAKIWLDQALKADSSHRSLVFQYASAQHGLKTGVSEEEVISFIEALRNPETALQNETLNKVYHLASLDLEAQLMQNLIENFDNDYTEDVVEIVTFDKMCRETEEMPSCTVVVLEAMLAGLYGNLISRAQEADEYQAQLTRTQQYFDRATGVAVDLNDSQISAELKLFKARSLFSAGVTVTEKEMKEILAAFKKTQNYGNYIEVVQQYLSVLAHGKQWQKLMDVILDLLKFSVKQSDVSRYFLLLKGMELSHGYFQDETGKPGVSWMVDRLADYFKYVSDLIQELSEGENLEEIGNRQFEEFRRLFTSFEPISHFNIYVYYQYQYQSVKLLKLSLISQGDTFGIQVADSLLEKFHDDNNPLSIIRADWPDFKDVPNAVRNRTLNKCISISKGDLPKAAELMDFSYRNLRSYITFKEVNRLGYFLTLQTTSNRPLEQGIRYMFHDLYKKGTIFEVVFDMPKFLVVHSNSGFYSQDLEEALDIKGTTAKKYIKIMANIGMIYQEKIPGRKHFYRVQKEEIMKRLGSEQVTMID